jgi:hypothetical protein
MVEARPDLARVLDAGAPWKHVVAAAYQLRGGTAIRETYTESDWLRELATFQQLVIGSLGSVGRDDVAVTIAGNTIQAFYPWDMWRSSLINAREVLLRLANDSGVEWSISVGLAEGDAIRFRAPDGAWHRAGWVVDRASALANRARPRQVLADSRLCEHAELNQLPEGSEFELRFGGTQSARIRGLRGPSKFREFLWSAGELRTEDHARNPIRKGILTSYNDDRGLVVTDSGERYYIDPRYIANGAPPRQGVRCIFVPQEPRKVGDANPIATAAVFIGSRIEGRVASVDVYEDRAFIEATDKYKNTQQLITAEGEDLTILSADAIVSFEVDENARGAVAKKLNVITTVLPPSSRRPDVASRFMAALLQHLRESGKQGAASAVARSSSLDFVASRIGPRRQRAQLFALANFAIPKWGVRGLRAVEDYDQSDILALLGPIQTPVEVQEAERVVAALRRELKELGPSPRRIPVRRERVSDILAEIQLGLRHLERMLQVPDTVEEDQEAALSAQHFAFALSQAFDAGVVTSLPPESRDVSKALAQM